MPAESSFRVPLLLPGVSGPQEVRLTASPASHQSPTKILMTSTGDIGKNTGMQGFWDLDYAVKCVQGGQPYVGKLRKPEAVAALRALVWFVQHLPSASSLLQEVRSLAGRRVDGLDKPGGVDHARQALAAQAGLRPYSYTAAIRAAGVPQAPPPRQGSGPAHSYVPPATLPRVSLQRLAAVQEREQEEAAAAAKALLEDSQGLSTQGAGAGEAGVAGAGGVSGTGEEEEAVAAALLADSKDQMKTQGHSLGAEGDDSLLFSELGTLGTLSDPLEKSGGVGSAAGDGGGEDDNGPQNQVKSQVQGSSASRPRRKLVCPMVRRGDFCMDKDCPKEHPARCGDPRCFPAWRKDCLLWHVRHSSQRQQQQQRHHHHSQSQGNGGSAVPGRAGQPQSQGQWRHQGQQQQRRRGQQQLQPRQRQQQGQQGMQWRFPPPRPDLYPGWQRRERRQGQQEGQQQVRRLPSLLSPLQQHWQQQQQQTPVQQRPWPEAGLSYRDVVKGAIGQHYHFQVPLLDRLEAVERRLAGLAGLARPCQS